MQIVECPVLLRFRLLAEPNNVQNTLQHIMEILSVVTHTVLVFLWKSLLSHWEVLLGK